MLTVDEKILRYCGIGRVQLGVNGVDPVTVKVLVVKRKLLDFNLLLGMDTIKSVSRICIN